MSSLTSSRCPREKILRAATGKRFWFVAETLSSIFTHSGAATARRWHPLGQNREDQVIKLDCMLYPGQVSGCVGERGQGLLHSLSLQVTILASTSAMTLLSLLGFSNGCKQGWELHGSQEHGQPHWLCQYQQGPSRLGLQVSLNSALQINGGITGVVAGSEALQGQLWWEDHFQTTNKNIVFGWIVLTAQLVPYALCMFVWQQGRQRTASQLSTFPKMERRWKSTLKNTFW